MVLKLGHEMPVASLDTHTGKVVWALNSEIQTASLKGLVGDGSDVKDGERLAIVPKVRRPGEGGGLQGGGGRPGGGECVDGSACRRLRVRKLSQNLSTSGGQRWLVLVPASIAS